MQEVLSQLPEQADRDAEIGLQHQRGEGDHGGEEGIAFEADDAHQRIGQQKAPHRGQGGVAHLQQEKDRGFLGRLVAQHQRCPA
jgi:hypothetical protein